MVDKSRIFPFLAQIGALSCVSVRRPEALLPTPPLTGVMNLITYPNTYVLVWPGKGTAPFALWPSQNSQPPPLVIREAVRSTSIHTDLPRALGISGVKGLLAVFISGVPWLAFISLQGSRSASVMSTRTRQTVALCLLALILQFLPQFTASEEGE